MNRQSMTSESHTASIDYRATIVVRSFICECDVALEQYRRLIKLFTQFILCGSFLIGTSHNFANSSCKPHKYN